MKLQTDEKDMEVNTINSTFQVARVTRPLMSVSRICDNDLTAHFDKEKAVIKISKGKVICVFRRKGGLYVCRLKLKPSSPFTRPGR